MLFDRPDKNSNAFLVHLEYQGDSTPSLSELHALTISAGLNPREAFTAKRQRPHPATFIGAGKVAELRSALSGAQGAQGENGAVIVFNHDLSPTQERNLEQELGCRVLGRTGLILDIFAQRAQTYEGKLQVELAQLQHMRTRLVRGWTHLDRQRGGSGRTGGAGSVLGGAGETQLEADQRMVGQRIKAINARLQKVKLQRAQRRRARSRSEVQTVSLVGYTNAGKSTLFNKMAASQVEEADKLFATLDPTIRSLDMNADGMPVGKVVLADTVGFLRDLPHTLVDAFRATLEEVAEADLLLHVVDAASPDRDEHIDAVNAVLSEIEADGVPQLIVFNKADLVSQDFSVDRDANGQPRRVWVSAKTGAGIDILQECICGALAKNMIDTVVAIEPSESKLRADLYAEGVVNSELLNEDGLLELRLRIDGSKLKHILSRNS